MIKRTKSKFKPTLKKKAKEELAKEEEQRRLHEKYKAVEEDKVIIEKAHYLKVFLSTIIFWVIIILLVFLVFCGACSLVFDGPRAELIAIYQSALEYLQLP